MSNQETKKQIEQALKLFTKDNLRTSALHLLQVLGYKSDRQLELSNTPDAFLAELDPSRQLNIEKAIVSEWQTVDFLFQLTDTEIRSNEQIGLFDSTARVDNSIIESYVFIAIQLKETHYTRTQLAHITREVNKLFPMPAMLLFRHDQTLTLSIINRRLHKKDAGKDVLEKVTLIKGIRLANPHRAHLEILADLSLDNLYRGHAFTNFVGLHRAWQKTLDSSELNKRFFQEVANWYFWAVQTAVFPPDAGPDAATRNAVSVIRLITRLIFVWFLKEKGLVPDDLFNAHKVAGLLRYDDPQGSAYYKAVLQNLFFATLNQEMNTAAKPDNRKFRGDGRQHYNITNLYRYKRYFQDPAEALSLFSTIPFLNGGLFECLDKPAKEGGTRPLRIDGFSDRPDNELVVPDELFFGAPYAIDLNATYGTSGKKYNTRGLIHIFNSYKFTIEENTPIEEEIALDPELLGKVFENLLAAYNPETETTARKQTGSFYTPREIVDYMVDESLIAYLETAIHHETSKGITTNEAAVLGDDFNRRLRHLFAYNEEPHQFNEQEVQQLIRAIDNLKVLDPAVGSGAFPMGVLQKLVFILGKLDPHNERWRDRQIAKAAEIEDSTVRRLAIEEIERAFDENELDYNRKLYLIESCIYGVDIQPIAVQISKLRFFISLMVDQTVNDNKENRGILPLPNLETKFVAANTLLGIEKPKQLSLRNPAIDAKERELAEVRRRHFVARTPKTKQKYREQDAQLRAEIGELLRQDGFPNETTRQLAHWDPYDQNASADFFDMEWMFGLENGFDIVIGNPPYVRQERIKELKPTLQKQYHCYTGIADLYIYFFEAGFKLLKQGGILTFISSNKYFRAGYGEKLRRFLGRQATIRILIDFGDAPVFTAIAYPSIIILQKAEPDGHSTRILNWQPGQPIEQFVEVFNHSSFLVEQQALGSDGWRLERPSLLQLLDKLRQTGKPLGEYVNDRFYRGILTGLNEAFVVDRATRDRLIAEHPSSAELLKPFLRGRDVKRWQVNFADQYLIKIESSANKQHPWTSKQNAEKIFAQTYPAIYAYFQPLRDKLIKRYDQGQYFWELRACAYWREFEKPKIIIPAIAQTVDYAPDSAKFYTNDKTSICVSDSVNYLIGLLNSKLLWWFIQQTAASRQGGFYEFKPMYVSQLPIAQAPDPKPIESLVEQILEAKRANPAADVSALERQIDQLVYQLYGLTTAEIDLIEGQTVSEEALLRPQPQTLAEVRSNDSSRLSTPPLLFTGIPPQGSFSEKRARLETLTRQASPAAIQELVAALSDNNETIRWQATAALRTIGGTQVASVLQAFIMQTENLNAKQAAQELLEQISSY